MSKAIGDATRARWDAGYAASRTDWEADYPLVRYGREMYANGVTEGYRFTRGWVHIALTFGVVYGLVGMSLISGDWFDAQHVVFRYAVSILVGLAPALFAHTVLPRLLPHLVAKTIWP